MSLIGCLLYCVYVSSEQPREHEAGGNFGNGVIGRRYVMGQNIEVEIDLTTNHWGHFVLKLCPLNDVTEIVTQGCHVSIISDGVTIILKHICIHTVTSVSDFTSVTFSPENLRHALQGGWSGCSTGNRERLSKFQVCSLAQLCLAAA